MNKLLNRIQQSMNFNKFFFELKRIPLIKNKVSDFIYDRYDLKQHWFFNPYLFNNVMHVFTKTFYVSFVALLGAGLSFGAEELALPYQFIDGFVLLWFIFLSIGSMNYETNFTSTSMKTFLISFRLPFKDYFKHHLKKLGFDRLIYMIVMGVILFVLNVSIVDTWLVLLTILMMLVYTIAKKVHYAFKIKEGKVSRFKKVKANPFDAFSLVVFIGVLLVFKATVTLVLINAYFSFWLLFYYRKYKGIDFYEDYHRVLQVNFKENESLLSSVSAITVDSVTIDEEIELKDFKIDDYQGYDLFNELFIQRLSFLWEKQFKRVRLVLSAGLLLLYFVLMGFDSIQEMLFRSDIHTRLLSLYIFFLYFTEIGKRLTQAYYYNADYSLLHYPFYFEKGNLWRQFLVRLKTIFKIHLYVSGTLILFTWLYTFTFKEYIDINTQIRFTLLVVSLMLMVSIFDLALYYLMQPFTKSLEVDNKVYSTIYAIFYLTLYVIELDVNNLIHVGLVIGFTIILLLVSLISVYMFSTKTFKYKD